MDDLDTVADEKYLEAYRLAAEFLNIYKDLPEVGALTLAYREKVERMDEIYSNMTEYQKQFLTDDIVKGMNEYIKKMKDLVTVAEGNKDESTGSADDIEENEDEEGEDGDKVEGDE